MNRLNDKTEHWHEVPVMTMKPNFRSFLASFSACTTLLAVSQGAFADPPPTNEIYFTHSPTFAGSGCRPGTAISSLSSDRRSFNVTFENYVAEVNPGQLFARKFCDITAEMHIPEGWSFAITSVTYRGAVQLDRGTSARENSTYYFYGYPGSAQLSSTWAGPIDDFGLPDPYEFTDELPMVNRVWSRCGVNAPLRIKTTYSVRNNSQKTGHAYASADTIDGNVSTIYHFAYRQCQ